MKRVVLRTMPDQNYGTLSWADIVQQVIRRPLDGRGADIDELRRGIRVLDALDAANGSVELEDADWEHLRQKVQAMQWGFVDRRIVQFVDDVNTAQEVT